MTEYEVFNSLIDAQLKTENINVLFGYPNGAETYRECYLHPSPEDNRAVALVTQELIDACSGMTPEQRLNYYNSANLKPLPWVLEQGWFPNPS